MDEIRFVDTTLRDRHRSLWAEAMLTGMILPIAAEKDRRFRRDRTGGAVVFQKSLPGI